MDKWSKLLGAAYNPVTREILLWVEGASNLQSFVPKCRCAMYTPEIVRTQGVYAHLKEV